MVQGLIVCRNAGISDEQGSFPFAVALPGMYRVQSVAEIPILRRIKYQARNRDFNREFCERL
jgi:hypothetical protein